MDVPEPSADADGRSEGRRTLVGGVAAWVVVSLLQAFVLAAQEDLPFLLAIFSMALFYGVLALLAIPVWYICAWQGREQRPAWMLVVLHLVLPVAVLGLWLGSYVGMVYLAGGEPAVREQLAQGLWILLQSLTIYTLMVSGMLWVQTSRRLERQRRREARLQLLAREAEVRALRAQLRPHFLFNVLNSIYSLTHSEPEKAREMVALLADLMRATLEASDQRQVALADEIELVKRYLDIEAIRLGERLTVEINLAPSVRDVPVPPFLLQPVVENSIKHGIAATRDPGRIEVRAAPRDHGLELVVSDTGVGLEVGGSRAAEGRGLQITRARLQSLYGSDFSLQLRDAEPRGCEVRLWVPLAAEVHGRNAR